MILGIGVDLVAVHRLVQLWARYGERLAKRLLSPEERQEFVERLAAFALPAADEVALVRDAWAARFLAKRFAAKEAFAKAWGSGIGRELAFSDLTLAHHRSGQPYWRFSSRFADAWTARRAHTAHLSLTDEADQVIAFVVIEGHASDG
jgi:holo-[acyl-carrier protein] synthase